MAYQTRQQLEQTHAVLHNSITLSSGMQLAQWSNHHDHVAVLSDHHTLSMYVREGYESYQKTAHGWKNGGGPGRFCLMALISPKCALTSVCAAVSAKALKGGRCLAR